jgi:hypothetical protein
MSGVPTATARGASRSAALEVKAVGAEAFDDVYPLLQRFPTQTMTREEWRWALFGYPWSRSPTRGHALYADGRAVGFLGTVVSERVIAGKLEKICNPSSWIVLDEYRYAASLLLRPLLKLRDHTIVGLTPSPAAYAMLSGVGLKPLETHQLVLLPVPGPVQLARALRGSFSLDPRDLRAELTGNERRVYDDHAASPVARHVLLRSGGRHCYLVATVGRKRFRVRFADVQHVSDPAFLWENRLLAQVALVRALGVAGLLLAVDSRFLVGRAPWNALRWKARRLFRPTRSEIRPEMIDGLYSEQMGIRY